MSLTLCTLCIVLISAILRIHDGQPYSSWKFYFSLNVIASILGKFITVTLLVAVSACLAQAKWVWFRKRSDTINMFKMIDSSSREETWSSLRLIWHTKGRRV